ncbi:hypothetical protein [Ferrimonas balearica]|uniref:hypothetical protein n=1 Tax=Ferrimonas balearica TaxID=44012 RepID=UPI001C98B629|nr:hypothetical protein [Ferrimonas balearica]MBY6225203.1 hypothetical protein [Ferrimonas balearica]
MVRNRWTLFPLAAGVLWLAATTLWTRLPPPKVTPQYAAAPAVAIASSVVTHHRITPDQPIFDSLARAYRRHGDVVEYGGKVWLADDNGQALLGFVAIADLTPSPAPEAAIQQEWQRFYQDHRWGDWSQDWLKPAWLGPMGEPLSHALMCRERRCLAGLDFDTEPHWQDQIDALQQRLPRHVELRELHAPSHALLIFTRY